MDDGGFVYHFRELKSRLKHSAIVFVFLCGLGWFVSDHLLVFIQNDLAVELHAVRVYEVIYARLNIAFMFGLAFTLPVLCYQLLNFAKPGLTKTEYRYLRNFLPLSFVLFVLGSVFAYVFVISSALNFFYGQTLVSGIQPIWSLSNTIGFIVRISALTGLLFQVPIFIYILNSLGVVDKRKLKLYRPYFVVSVLFVSALATPPDIITQVLITLPVILLYEITLRLIR